MTSVIVGVLILAAGLLLARTAPTWSGALLAIGVIVEAIGSFAALDLVALAGSGPCSWRSPRLATS